jgi:hypothetical protein
MKNVTPFRHLPIAMEQTGKYTQLTITQENRQDDLLKLRELGKRMY